MFGFDRIVVAQNQRAVMLREGNFEGILLPGVYRFWNPLGRIAIRFYDLGGLRFDSTYEDYLVAERPALVDATFDVFETGETEVGLVYRKDKLVDLLAPNTRRLYWKAYDGLRFETQDIREDFALAADKVGALVRARAGDMPAELLGAIYAAEIADNTVGLLVVDGKLLRTLQPGLYAYWKYNRDVKVEQIDLRPQMLDVQGQEILTLDKVSLRINLAADYQVIDPVEARNAMADIAATVYRELQFALRQAVGARNLDTLLSNKSELDTEIFDRTRKQLADRGLALRSVGVKDVILPGDMKTILNQVVEAEKVAEANVIKRRDETSATRSMLNAAKLMESNPTLMRLKELEVLENVTGKVDKLTVFGGLDGVLRDTVRIDLDT